MAPGALVLHGFTGTPQSVLGLGEAFRAAGFDVDVPLLPGHGGSDEDLMATGWSDWSKGADEAYQRLAQRCEKVVVAGLSMGGALAAWLGARYADIPALVTINPFIDPPASSFRDLLRGVLDSGASTVPGIGGDVADPEVAESAGGETPILPLLSLCDGLDEVMVLLPEIRCPLLIFTSKVDHVVPTVSSDVLAANVGGPVERVLLENSFHVATLDHDRDEIERRAVAFARSHLAGPETTPG